MARPHRRRAGQGGQPHPPALARGEHAEQGEEQAGEGRRGADADQGRAHLVPDRPHVGPARDEHDDEDHGRDRARGPGPPAGGGHGVLRRPGRHRAVGAERVAREQDGLARHRLARRRAAGPQAVPALRLGLPDDVAVAAALGVVEQQQPVGGDVLQRGEQRGLAGPAVHGHQVEQPAHLVDDVDVGREVQALPARGAGADAGGRARGDGRDLRHVQGRGAAQPRGAGDELAHPLGPLRVVLDRVQARAAAGQPQGARARAVLEDPGLVPAPGEEAAHVVDRLVGPPRQVEGDEVLGVVDGQQGPQVRERGAGPAGGPGVPAAQQRRAVQAAAGRGHRPEVGLAERSGVEQLTRGVGHGGEPSHPSATRRPRPRAPSGTPATRASAAADHVILAARARPAAAKRPASAQGGVDAGRDGGGVGGVDEGPGAGRELGHGRAAGGDDRDAVGHGLEHRHPEALPQRRVGQDGGPGVGGVELVGRQEARGPDPGGDGRRAARSAGPSPAARRAAGPGPARRPRAARRRAAASRGSCGARACRTT